MMMMAADLLCSDLPVSRRKLNKWGRNKYKYLEPKIDCSKPQGFLPLYRINNTASSKCILLNNWRVLSYLHKVQFCLTLYSFECKINWKYFLNTCVCVCVCVCDSCSSWFLITTIDICFLMAYVMGAQIPCSTSPWRLYFVEWGMIFVDLQYELASCHPSGA
jgi:hypothetical protein